MLSLECQVQVRVFREDLVDILANLLRNACDAVLEYCVEGERRVGIRIVEEMDSITGLSWVAIRVVDSAPGPLTDAMLKERRIGRGVGLAMDLAKRSQGSLKVEDEPGWAKAVVLRLAVAEEMDS
jgi:C4-dicarboxylate-specific signal transduction histidine kinase